MAYPEILILRHLSRRPAHGYELRKRIEETTGIVVNNNSLYPALKRFVEAGAVAMTVERHDSRPPRHVYELTDVGRELLHDLLAELPESQAGDETEFLTRIGQFDLLEPEERVAVIDSRARALSRTAERLASLQQRAGGEFWGTTIVTRLHRRVTDELEWLTELRERALRE